MIGLRFVSIPGALLSLVGPSGPGAAPREDPLTHALAGRTRGQSVACVEASRLDPPQVIDEKTLLYRESGRRTWRNDLPEACRGLRPMSTLVTAVFGSQLCRDDSFRALDPGSLISTTTCRLGRFTPYDRPTLPK